VCACVCNIEVGQEQGGHVFSDSPVPFPAGTLLLCYAQWLFQRTEGNLIQWDPPLFC
jgi:hypothetical protein